MDLLHGRGDLPHPEVVADSVRLRGVHLQWARGKSTGGAAAERTISALRACVQTCTPMLAVAGAQPLARSRRAASSNRAFALAACVILVSETWAYHQRW